MAVREMWLCHRDTGIRCLVTVTKKGKGARANFSFRDEGGFPVVFLDEEFPRLVAWLKSCKRELPTGWDLAS